MKHKEHRRHRNDDEISRKTGTTKDQRIDWSDAVNDKLERMREADKAGNDAEASRHGDDVMKMYQMGPKKYIQFINFEGDN